MAGVVQAQEAMMAQYQPSVCPAPAITPPPRTVSGTQWGLCKHLQKEVSAMQI